MPLDGNIAPLRLRGVWNQNSETLCTDSGKLVTGSYSSLACSYAMLCSIL